MAVRCHVTIVLKSSQLRQQKNSQKPNKHLQSSAASGSPGLYLIVQTFIVYIQNFWLLEQHLNAAQLFFFTVFNDKLSREIYMYWWTANGSIPFSTSPLTAWPQTFCPITDCHFTNASYAWLLPVNLHHYSLNITCSYKIIQCIHLGLHFIQWIAFVLSVKKASLIGYFTHYNIFSLLWIFCSYIT